MIAKKDPDHLFMGLFQGEGVTLLLRTQIESEEGLFNMAVMGYLIDADEEWVYIGGDPNNVREAVKREDVLRVMFGMSEDDDSIPTPKGSTH